ncbi:hypothetical protein PYW07_008285 [Mythimna separata]|uniref:CRAL-TRIO domain-containing protein n=1 Tax=Mythimna separata TaxID=271217 RepID=A0AAD7YDF7_MYTSE|nr:hypothetical protein PYW07_008285 [Mythimna separata]
MDIIVEPENKLIKFGPEVVEEIRKEYNFDNEANREQAITIINEWIKSQEHLIKKDYSKPYIEKSIITSKGSLERAKKQIDKICTFRTLMPKYFQVTNIFESDIARVLNNGLFALVPTLTQEYHRVIIIKVNPSADVKQNDYVLLFKLFVVVAEYLKNTDFCRGFTLICDMYDSSTADVLSKLNLVELQQFIPIITEGYGTKIKGIIFLTGSKFIDGFVKIVKPFFSAKISSRIHVATSVEALKEFVQVDILPEEYGGKEQSIEILHDNLIKTISSESHQSLMKEMNRARTDESKRKVDKFNEQYMGMPGTFRTLSLD